MMNQLYIRNDNSENFTVVSNLFLDHFMPEANGEFVKIYFSLLRHMGGSDSFFSLLSIADRLNCTEKDVERALNYWSKHGILKLDYDDQKHLEGIVLLPLSGTLSTEKHSTKTTTITKSSPTPVKEVSDAPIALTPSRLTELKKNDDIAQLLFIAEQYLGKTLTPTDTSHLIYFYEVLGFSIDLIDYLIEYCVLKGSKSIHYIKSVALAWHQAGITTVAAAKKESNNYHKDYYVILKAFGITNRNPVDSEIQYMDCWLKKYTMPVELILEACNRTILQTGKPQFAYAQTILDDWHNKKVSTLNDVSELDQFHKKSKKSSSPTQHRKATNKFNDFPQRSYDYNELEKHLLSK